MASKSEELERRICQEAGASLEPALYLTSRKPLSEAGRCRGRVMVRIQSGFGTVGAVPSPRFCALEELVEGHAAPSYGPRAGR